MIKRDLFVTPIKIRLLQHLPVLSFSVFTLIQQQGSHSLEKSLNFRGSP